MWDATHSTLAQSWCAQWWHRLTVGGQATAGSFGVPVIVAQALNAACDGHDRGQYPHLCRAYNGTLSGQRLAIVSTMALGIAEKLNVVLHRPEHEHTRRHISALAAACKLSVLLNGVTTVGGTQNSVLHATASLRNGRPQYCCELSTIPAAYPE